MSETPDLDRVLQKMDAEEKAKAEARFEDLEDTISGMLRLFPFFGYLIRRLRWTFDSGVPSVKLGQDRTVRINPDWYDAASRGAAAWTLARLALHGAFHCWERRGSRDPELWTLAQSIVFARDLKEAGLGLPTMPDGSKPPHVESWKELSDLHIYEKLAQEDNGGGPDPSDSGEGQPNQSEEPPPPGSMQEMIDKARADNTVDYSSPPEGRGGSSEEWDDQTRSAAEYHKRRQSDNSSPGKLPLGIERLVQSLYSPKLPWYMLLSREMQNLGSEGYSYRSPSRRMQSVERGQAARGIRVRFPGPRGSLRRVEIYVDTSGSMDEDQLKKAVSEAMGVLGGGEYPVWFGTYDHEAYDVGFVTEAPQLKLMGGGGTSPAPALKRAVEREERMGPATAVVIFSDLEHYVSDWAEPEAPVLWVQTEGRDPRDVPFGKVILYDAQ